MARRVHEIQGIGFAILGRIGQAHGLRLDGDTAFLLQLHIVQNLLFHLTGCERTAGLDQPVSQRGLSMVDMRDDREIADLGEGRAGHGAIHKRLRRSCHWGETGRMRFLPNVSKAR